MGIGKTLREARFKNNLMYYINRFFYEFKVFSKYRIHSDKHLIISKYKKIFGYKPNLSNPQTLNEKIQWLKLNEHKSIHTIYADKYEVRKYLSEQFGDSYLVPLIYKTNDWRYIIPENIDQYPCIIKANHTSGDYIILRSKDEVNWNTIQRKCRWWLNKDYYAISQEWQYKNIKRLIVVEKLLQTKIGKIPNDYKLHYINGQLEFVYVSVDREGVNKRNIYDKYWNPLPFAWVQKESLDNVRGEEIESPKSFEKMKMIGEKIASTFKYVRVDFYDVDGDLFFGEITLHHGSGFDVFSPVEYDLKYGQLLNLSNT